MMYFRSFLLTMLGIFLLVSCRDDMNSPSFTRHSVLFTPVIAADGVISRAANDNWNADDRIGIYMVPHTLTATADFFVYADSANVQYRASESGTSSPLVAVSSQIFYPADGSDVNFVAYYPYKSDVHTTHNHIYPVDVSTQVPLSDIDLLYHKGTGVPYCRGDSAVSLGFAHQLSKLNIRVVRENSTVVDFSTATSSTGLEGFPRKVDFNLSTGKLDVKSLSDPSTNGSPLVPVKDTIISNADSVVFESILVPHDGADYTRTIHVDIDGNTYSYMLPTTRNFESGNAYSYRFIFTGRGLILGGNTITDWGSVAIGDIEFSVSTNVIELPATVTTGNAFTIRTNSSGTPTCSISTSATSVVAPGTNWITNVSFGTPSINNGWKTYEVSFDTEENTSETTTNELYLHLTISEGKTLVVKVKQDKKKYLKDLSMADFALTAAAEKSSFTIKTNSKENLTISYWDGTKIIPRPNWIVVESPTYTKTGDEYTYTIIFQVTDNMNITSRDITIRIGVENLSEDVSIEHDESKLNEAITIDGEQEANCYIVPPGGAIRHLPIGRARAVDWATSVYTVETLWDDNNVIGTPMINEINGHDFITVITTTNVGNALVAIKSVNREIMWSYHIWVTDYNPDEHGNSWENNLIGASGNIFMLRDLGAKTNERGAGGGYGLFYQWGRKDPFFVMGGEHGARMRGFDFKTVDTSNPVDIDYAIKNPTTFLSRSTVEEKWWYDDDIWGDEGSKTIYDPCPHGWRIPKFRNDIVPWKGFNRFTNPEDIDAEFSYGLVWRNQTGQTINFSSNGYFNSFGKELNWPGNKGGLYRWTSRRYKYNEGHSIALCFSPRLAIEENDQLRSDALAIRCEKDE